MNFLKPMTFALKKNKHLKQKKLESYIPILFHAMHNNKIALAADEIHSSLNG